MLPNESEKFDDPCRRDNRRRSGRLPLEALRCDLGRIEDISSTGMRVRSWRKPPVPELALVLYGYDATESIRVNCRVMWTKREGMFRYEIGVQFLDLTPELSRRLTLLATAHRHRQVLG